MDRLNQQSIKSKLLLTITTIFVWLQIHAQICPPNIDFEQGNFINWRAYTGGVSAQAGANVISLTEGESQASHQIFTRALHSLLKDEFGNFPVVCPNGSGHSVKLGNTSGGGRAEGLSYEFTIPASRNEYSLTYYYAIVFEGPNHQEHQQPRLEIEVMNISDNKKIDCSSFTFISYGSGLPGFEISPIQVNDNATVLYKDWTPVTINLNGMAGKTIRLFFKTADCTFVRHFGYAYIDVNTECNGEFPGAAFCPNDAFVKVTAPFGFASYKWFSSDFSQVLGSSIDLTITPAPSSGTTIAVEVTPFAGFGCKDTIYTKLVDTLTVKAEAGKNASYCGTDPVILGEPPKTGRVYSWSPVAGLSDPRISNPLATPGQTTNYVLTVSSNGGGCIDRDEVTVISLLPDTTLLFLGKNLFCSTSGDSAVLFTQNGVNTQWYKEGVALPGATNNRFKVNSSGTYYALVKSNLGCTLSTRSVTVKIDIPQVGILYPLRYTFVDNSVTFNARDLGDTFAWRPPVFLNNSQIMSPVFTPTRLGAYTYIVRIVAQSGCVSVDTQQVKIISKVEVFLPNAFTPDNNHINDLFSPITIGIETIQVFKVFNRLGNEVFSWSALRPGWDGVYKNILQDPGTYVWQFSGTGIDGIRYDRKGFVLLIR